MPSQYLWAACHRTSLKQGPSPRHHSPLPLSSASSRRDSPPTALPKPCLPGPSRSPGVPRRQAVFGKPSNFSGARPPSPPKPIHCCVCPQRPLRESALVFIFPPSCTSNQRAPRVVFFSWPVSASRASAAVAAVAAAPLFGSHLEHAAWPQALCYGRPPVDCSPCAAAYSSARPPAQIFLYVESNPPPPRLSSPAPSTVTICPVTLLCLLY